MNEIAVQNSVILWERLGRGGYWRLTDHGDGLVSLQNMAETGFRDWYLDIDGHSGDVIMWDRLGRGGYWKLTDHADGTISLQNNADTKFKDWYLDIDGQSGDVILWDRKGSGGNWKFTRHQDGAVSLQNNAETPYKDWYLDIDGGTAGDLQLSPKFPIEFEQHDKVGDGFHMTTKVTVSESGRLDGFVETKSTNSIKGFRGQVFILLLDRSKNILWNTEDTHRYGVNAAGLNSSNTRNDHFTESVPNDILKNVRKVFIYHKHNPITLSEFMERFAEVNDAYKKIKESEIVQDIITIVANS